MMASQTSSTHVEDGAEGEEEESALPENSQGLARPQRSTLSPNSTVCYDYVGCFSNTAPFNNTNFELPQTPAHVNTTFMLYTRRSSEEMDFEVLPYKNDTPLPSSNFDPSHMTRVIHSSRLL
ncbi:hypothetical protein ACOMHN_010409 [Nucella lapillus]